MNSGEDKVQYPNVNIRVLKTSRAERTEKNYKTEGKTCCAGPGPTVTGAAGPHNPRNMKE